MPQIITNEVLDVIAPVDEAVELAELIELEETETELQAEAKREGYNFTLAIEL